MKEICTGSDNQDNPVLEMVRIIFTLIPENTRSKFHIQI